MTGNLPFTPEQVKLIQASTFARVGRISGTQVTDEPLTKFPCRPGHEPAACISGTCASILKRGVLASDHDERLQKIGLGVIEVCRLNCSVLTTDHALFGL